MKKLSLHQLIEKCQKWIKSVKAKAVLCTIDGQLFKEESFEFARAHSIDAKSKVYKVEKGEKGIYVFEGYKQVKGKADELNRYPQEISIPSFVAVKLGKESKEDQAKAEEAAKKLAEAKAEELDKKEAAAKSKAEAENKAKAKKEADEKDKLEADAKTKEEVEAKAKDEADAKIKANADEKAKLEAEADAKSKTEADEKEKSDAEAEAKKEALSKLLENGKEDDLISYLRDNKISSLAFSTLKKKDMKTLKEMITNA